jgi:hypothetical protein
MVMSPAGLGLERDNSGKAQKKLCKQITDPTSRQRGAQHQETRSYETEEEILAISCRTEWPTERRSQPNCNLSAELLTEPLWGQLNWDRALEHRSLTEFNLVAFQVLSYHATASNKEVELLLVRSFRTLTLLTNLILILGVSREKSVYVCSCVCSLEILALMYAFRLGTKLRGLSPRATAACRRKSSGKAKCPSAFFRHKFRKT